MDSVNNNLVQGKSSQKEESLNPEILSVINDYSQDLIKSRESHTPIHVDEIASGIAKFYEKVRKVIDWKDDNVLRRGAIERILKRILFPKMVGFDLKDHNSKELAQTVTLELIRSGHLSNHVIPQERVEVVSIALTKYLVFLEYIFNNYNTLEFKNKTNLATFVLEIAACEVEEILTNPVKEKGIANAMAKILNERISIIKSGSLSSDEKFSLVNISTQRKLYHLDDNYIVYQLLKARYPNWFNPSAEEIKEISKKLPHIQKSVYENINRPINRKFDDVAENIDTVFLLLDDVLEGLKDKPEEIKSIFENKEKLICLITDCYNKRNKTLKTRLRNSAIFSTLSVFLSNWVTFFLIEVPLAQLFYEKFNLVAAIVDFLVPTLVMFLLIIFIKPPKDDNLKKVISAALSFVYTDEGKENYEIDISEKKSTKFSLAIKSLYVVIAILSFIGIAYGFYFAQLPITSVIYDTFTIALTVFAAVVVRNQSKELNVGDDRNFKDFIFDILTVPIAKVGYILSKKWKEYNVVGVFFNFIVEVPLAATLDFIQGWSEDIKERKSDFH